MSDNQMSPAVEFAHNDKNIVKVSMHTAGFPK
jgi:hypothetical protein